MPVDIRELRAKTKLYSLLYVEDETTLRETTLTFFSNFFDDIVAAKDGIEALEHYKRRTFDLIITDIHMPNMDGIALSKEIRSLNRHQYIIILSAHNDETYFQASIDIGIDGYILKPLQTELCMQTFEKAVFRIAQTKDNIRYQDTLEKEVARRTKELEDHLITDTVTKLPNRLALNKRFNVPSTYNAVLFNIDNFSSVNISFGYDIGDNVLQKVSTFLLERLPPKATIYRIGSDEFLLLSSVYDVPFLKEFAQGIIHKFINTTLIIDEAISLHLSLTASLASGDEKNIVQNVELGLMQAKRKGKSHVFEYTKESALFGNPLERLEWIHRVKIALEKEQVTPFYQPIIDNATQNIVKYECLARIVDNGKIITPNYFIEPARLSGQISEITKQMIQKSCQTFSKTNFEFSLNITSEDLNANYLPDYILHYAKKYSIEPERIVLEVLENISTFDQESTIAQLKHLKRLGLKIAIDDFGNEHSNFSRLLDIQADYIKIDGQFIKSLHEDPKSHKITTAITQLAKSLDAKVIAEFVHNQAVYEKVRSLGIDFSQGYYFGIPSATISKG